MKYALLIGIGTPSAGGFTVAYLDTIKKPQTWNSLLEQVTQKIDLQTPELSTGQQ